MGKIRDAKIHLYALIKYVDDVNTVASMLGLRWSWREDMSCIEWSNEREQLDREAGKSKERAMMDIIHQTANSVFEWLKFTTDLPQDHPSCMVPCLDLQLWVCHEPMSQEEKSGLGGLDRTGPRNLDTLAWRFYSKPSSSNKVIRATTAFNWRSLLVTLNQEVFRHLRNTSRQVDINTRLDILAGMINKMKRSGYSTSTIDGVLTSGVNLYYSKLRQDLEGGAPMNVRSTDNQVARRRAKQLAASNWFARRRRGGVQDRMKRESKTRNPLMTTCDNRQPWKTRHGVREVSRDHPVSDSQAALGTPETPRGLGATHAEEHGLTKEVEVTLLVPFTNKSALMSKLQENENKFAANLRARRVRMLERGGPNCAISSAVQTQSLQRGCVQTAPAIPATPGGGTGEQVKTAKEQGVELPKPLLKPGANHCQREGVLYTLQCVDCALLDIRSTYEGEHQIH